METPKGNSSGSNAAARAGIMEGTVSPSPTNFGGEGRYFDEEDVDDEFEDEPDDGKFKMRFISRKTF